jgi:hypothetical protein
VIVVQTDVIARLVAGGCAFGQRAGSTSSKAGNGVSSYRPQKSVSRC